MYLSIDRLALSISKSTRNCGLLIVESIALSDLVSNNDSSNYSSNSSSSRYSKMSGHEWDLNTRDIELS